MNVHPETIFFDYLFADPKTDFIFNNAEFSTFLDALDS